MPETSKKSAGAGPAGGVSAARPAAQRRTTTKAKAPTKRTAKSSATASATASARVTIVTRTRDRAILLQRALDDVLAQTFQDWNLVVVNDGGDSAPVDALIDARKGQFNDRVTVIHVDGGTGSMEAAANLGAQTAQGDFVVVHDDDDTWDPQFLELMVAALDADPQAVAATARTQVIIERIDGDTVVQTDEWPWSPPSESVTLFDLLQTNRFVPISLLVRRSVYDAIGWYDPTLIAVGDWEFNLRLVQHGKVLFVGDRPLAFWHQRPNASGSHSNSIFGGDKGHMQFDRMVRDRELQKYIDQNGIGGLLYLAKYIEETSGYLEGMIRYYSFGETMRRGYHRVLRKLRHPFRRS